MAAYETLKNDAETLKTITESFENSLISTPNKITDGKETPLVLIKETEKGKHFFTTVHGKLTGYLKSRGKDVDKTILKFLTRPEFNAQIALKDGIGCRITIEKEKAKELIPIICDWLHRERKVDFLLIENQLYFSTEDIKILEKSITGVISKNNFSIKQRKKKNSASAGDYITVKITGKLGSLAKQDKFATLADNAKQFEIQFVFPENKNEAGRMQHDVFDASKLIIARTRLDGYCPEDVFLEFVKDASIKSGISEKNIISFLTEGEEAPVTKMKKPNSKKKQYYYVADDVYSRWNEFGWIDASLYKDFEEAKNAK